MVDGNDINDMEHDDENHLLTTMENNPNKKAKQKKN
jgi:hypothetical protein